MSCVGRSQTPSATASPAVSVEAVRVSAAVDALADCMMEFRAYLGHGEDTEKRNCPRVEVAAAATANRCEFLVVGDPAHSFAQLTCSRSIWYGADVCRVELLFVTSQHRCCGVGRALMVSQSKIVSSAADVHGWSSTPTNTTPQRSRCTGRWGTSAKIPTGATDAIFTCARISTRLRTAPPPRGWRRPLTAHRVARREVQATAVVLPLAGGGVQ